VKSGDTLNEAIGLCLTAWQALVDSKPFAEIKRPDTLPTAIPGRTVEAALLDRSRSGPVQYRTLELN